MWPQEHIKKCIAQEKPDYGLIDILNPVPNIVVPYQLHLILFNMIEKYLTRSHISTPPVILGIMPIAQSNLVSIAADVISTRFMC